MPDSNNKKTTLAVPRKIPNAAILPSVACLQLLAGSNAGQLIRLEGEEIVIGRDEECQICLDEPGVSRRHAVIRREKQGMVLEDLQSRNGTFVHDDRIDRHMLRSGDMISFGGLLVKFGHVSETEMQLATRLFQGATRDHLTGTLNRGSFFERLEQELALVKRQEGGFSLMMLDIDHFKRINDTYGHPAGDAVLRQVADIIRRSCRMEDIFGRYGGEEFVLLLRDTKHTGALELAERLRGAVAEHVFKVPTPDGEQDLHITVSIGVSTWSPPMSRETLISLADGALYQAKETGRNRVMSGLS